MAVYVATLGILAALAATAFSGWQVYLLRAQLAKDDHVDRAAFYQSVTRAFADLNRIFVENPHLRPYFFEGRRCEDDPALAQQLMAISGYIVDTAEGCTAVEDVLTNLSGDWDDHFNFLYRSSPALRDWWAAMGHLYPEEVRRCLLGPSLRPKAWPSQPAPHFSSPNLPLRTVEQK